MLVTRPGGIVSSQGSSSTFHPRRTSGSSRSQSRATVAGSTVGAHGPAPSAARDRIEQRSRGVMRNSICDQLGMEYPVLAFSHCRDVVAAVSRAGGFGVLGATTLTPEQLEIELRWIDEAVGGRPYGVDVLVPEKLTGMERGGHFDAAALAEMIPEEHRRFLDSLLQEYGIEPSDGSDAEHWDLLTSSPSEGMAAGLT